MPQAKLVENLIFHTSAGYSGVKAIENDWRTRLGWKSKGYAALVESDGTIWYLNDNTAVNGYTKENNDGKCFEFITNGVAGHNSSNVSICYIGGVDKATGKAKDTRTAEQKQSFLKIIGEFLQWCLLNGKDINQGLGMAGHRDFSSDKNGDGIIASNERIKECPCFDAIVEYRQFASPDRKGLLPTVKSANGLKEYVVVAGDSLSKIAVKFRTTILKIKKDNSLNSDNLKIGQKLKV